MNAQTVEINSVETVLRELTPLLEEVQRTLEQSLESDDPAAGAQAVTSRLREIRGTLQLLDLEGPTLLVDEMRALASALSQGEAGSQEAALEVLLKGVFKLPDYLDRIQAGRRDRPVVLLSLINELRSARGERALSERDVFKPRLEPIGGAADADGQAPAPIDSTAKRLRPRFQRALLGWYRNDNVEACLDELGTILHELADATASPATQRLWHVCGALTESLSDQGLEQDTDVKILMARVERLLSQLVREGEAALEQTIPLDLLRNLLYYVARSGSDSPRVRQVKETYQLEELLPGSGAEADFEGPNRGLLEVVGQGIRDDLASIRDSVEIYVHSEEGRPDVLEGLPERLKQVADTFSMVGLREDHRILRQEAQALAAFESLDADETYQRMQALADVLVRAESDLTALESGRPASDTAGRDAGELPIRDLPDSEYRPLLSAVIAAALDDLSKLREAIGAYCGDPDAGHEAVAEAPSLLAELEGAMAMLPLESALPLVRDLRAYIERELVENRSQPGEDTQVLLADVVAGLEYYLEAVDHDRVGMTHLLESASRAVTALQSGGQAATYSEDEQVVIESPPEEATADTPEASAQADGGGDAVAFDATVGESDTGAAPAGADDRGDLDELELAGDHAPAPGGEFSPTDSGDEADLTLEASEVDPSDLEVAADDAAAKGGESSPTQGDEEADLTLEGAELDASELESATELALEDEADLDFESDVTEAGEAAASAQPGAPRSGTEEAPTSEAGEVNASDDELELEADDVALDLAESDEAAPADSAPASAAACPEGEAGAAGESIERDASADGDSAAGEAVAAAAGGGRAGPGVDPAASGSQYAIVGEDVDDEIVEVFMEEALGELDKINEYLPKWKANPGDEDSLVVVRRAFHTLKGGGRLIGAELVGEFSWSMENMLNRVIDHSIDTTPVLFDTLDEAAAALPQLIEQIRGNRAPIEGIDDLIQRAHALSRGEEPPPGGGTGSPMPGKAPDGASGAVDDTASEEASSGGGGADEAGGLPGGGDVKPDAMSSGGVADGDIAAATGELAIETGDEPDAGSESPSGDAAPLEPASETAERVDGATASGGAEAPTPWSELEGLGELELDAPARSSGAGADARGDGDADEAPEGSKQTVDPSAIDEDLIASFVEEADELIDSCDQAVAQWRDHPDDTAAPAQIQRHLHTLKGGARMADLAPAGQLTHELESLVEAASAHPAARDGPLFDVLHEGVDTLTALLGEVRARRPISSPDELRGRINALRADALGTGDEGAHLEPDGGDAEASQGPSTAAELDEAEPPVDVECADDAQSGGGPDLDSGDVTRELDPSDPHPDAASAGPAAAEPSPPAEGQSVVEKASPEDAIDPESDDELMHSFLEESGELVERCDEAVSRWRNAPHEPEPGATLQRAFHTIKGGARMANVAPLGDLIHELESLLQGVDSGECDRNEALFDALQEAVDAMSAMLSEVGAGRAPAKPDELIARLASLRRGQVPGTEASATEGGHGAPGAASTPAEHAHEPATASAMAPEASDSLVAVFAQEAETHQTVLRDAFLDSEGAPVEAGQAIDMGVVRALHTLVGSAETAGCEAIAGLASPMEEIVKRRRDARSDLTAGDGAALGEAVRQLDTMLRHLRDHGEEPALPEPARERLIAQRDKAQADLDSSQDEGGDELVDVFLEEADELAEACDQGLARWREQPDDPDITSELQRSLHTLKGGARMAHLPPIADLTHEVESLIRAVDDGSRGVSEELFDLLQEAVDALTVLLEQVRGRQPIARVDWLIEDLQNLRERASGDAAAAPATRATDQPASEPAGAAPASTAEDSDDGTREQASAPAQASADASAAGSSDRADTSDGAEKDGDTAAQGGSSQSAAEQIRVRSDLLDNLVNYAGEVSIYHSRLGEQMGQYRFNLNEFEQTVNRLREQLRQMEDETEAQILYSGEKEKEEQAQQPSAEDFDPLEFDRYTRIQELSRSLSESVGDLDSIKEILENLTRDAETLLLQQSRVSSELQDGLMQTRMVRFDGLRARLSRVVRQTASQVGKKAQMRMTGGDLEVDRSIQERVVAPLEHVLRNAVSHGTETPAERREAGKPEQGTISLDLHRGGTDVILEISDDGSGIDPDAVRQRAIKRDLIAADDDRDDNEVIKLILETGFTTAEEVTQIAGRGVGMDVVDAEIRRLGGTLGISTVKGQGTRFTIRLPVTLAINQAVLVKAGDDTYAIPIASIEGVTQITAGDLKQYYIDPSQRLTYAEAEYRVQHLGTLLGTSEPKLDAPDISYPAIMVRAGDDRVALHIDGIQGRREVVVKPLGTPLNMLPGISGATIMADGSVVLILDIGGLLRTETRFLAAEAPLESTPTGTVETQAEAVAGEAEPDEQEQAGRTPTVLVVDDSITMRKVSHRILTRNGLEVATAKDGVDAMSWMAQSIPDVILLDIEMPRMDGYEVASNVRGDERLKEVPIIMVTSRTGDKHRQRAEDIGVNKYLGKPYQEGELMEEINAVIEPTETA